MYKTLSAGHVALLGKMRDTIRKYEEKKNNRK